MKRGGGDLRKRKAPPQVERQQGQPLPSTPRTHALKPPRDRPTPPPPPGTSIARLPTQPYTAPLSAPPEEEEEPAEEVEALGGRLL